MQHPSRRSLSPMFWFLASLAGAGCAVGVTPLGNGSGETDEDASTSESSLASDAGTRTDAKTVTGTDAAAKEDTAPSPKIVDAATACPGYALPNETATCHACQSTSPTCQPNGCYGGYYCDTSTQKCLAKPSGC